MDKKNKWIDLSILSLLVIGLSGVVLRSKIVFELPLINYNHLLEAHAHFTFGGWVTLALLFLMVYELLPGSVSSRRIYQWLLGSILAGAWAMFLTFLFAGYETISVIASVFFILVTYVFAWVFIGDVLKAKLPATVSALAICSVVSLVLSSAGSYILFFVFYTKSLDAILYRDALFTYLHFQYNGFFTLAIISLLFHHIGQRVEAKGHRNMSRFALLLIISIIPSLFLSYLWQSPGPVLRVVAVSGSVLLLGSFCFFVLASKSLYVIYREEKPVIRLLIFLSMGSFALKIFLQCFTIFPGIGNEIFGNRPIIMGFLHLVFLGFTSLFVLAYFAKKGYLDISLRSTRTGLLVFALAVLLNETLLMSQGLATTMLLPGGNVFPWLLWLAGLCLLFGISLVYIARRHTLKKL